MKRSKSKTKPDLASRCRCGFDFNMARLTKRTFKSYTLLPHKGYQQAIRREYAITAEKDADKKLVMILKAADRVGILTQCPECEEWTLLEPLSSVARRLTDRTGRQ